MKLAAADAIAAAVGEDELSPDFIVPSVFDKRVVTLVAEAVAEAAVVEGVVPPLMRERTVTGRRGHLRLLGTLVRVPTPESARDRRVAALGALMRKSGHEVGDDQLDAAIAAVGVLHHAHWQANEQYTYERAIDELFDLLEVTPDEPLRDAAVDEFTGMSSTFLPPLTDNIESVLAALSASGVRVGIICDVGLSPSVVLRRYLDGHGVLQHFDHWSFSDEVGVYKPTPEIFAHALAGLGRVPPQRAAHVGDLKATDVAGGRAAGMRTVRYRGDNDDGGSEGDDADVVVDDHADLLAALGL